MVLRPIGRVESSLVDRDAAPRQGDPDRVAHGPFEGVDIAEDQSWCG